ncbi:MAG TPA: thymidine phosphorylase [Gemmatimonadaceae bacterium]|jgi:pyrimidine-nucleoside phosphorylase|nr:thymidine phosphorylase [Gemmatimonadaceae bacterium]
MLAQRLIERKRNGGRLEPGEWRALVHAYSSGHVADHEMAAFLMAAYLRGLDLTEAHALLEALLGLGTPLFSSSTGAVRMDLHSTGGVSDKAWLVVGPLVASLGVPVPMVLGRGGDSIGGPLEKLLAIPGFRTRLTPDEARTQLDRRGCVIMECPLEAAPLDARLCALRHATATVESTVLVAIEIAARKLVSGLGGLVLDIKVGSGTFIQSPRDGLALAVLVAELVGAHGCQSISLLTAMDRPLGRAVGGALEVEEAIHALQGEGPPDLAEVSFALGAEMLLLARRASTREEARHLLVTAVDSGAAVEKLRQIIDAQGGNPDVVDDPALLPQAEECELFVAPQRGFVASVDPRPIARGLGALAAGAAAAGGAGAEAVGFVVSAKPGDWVEAGEPLATVFARTPQDIARGRAALAEAIRIAEEVDTPLPLVSHRVDAGRTTSYDEGLAEPGM